VNWEQYTAWEKTTDDTHDHKNMYVDIAGGDILAGLLLGEIVYWYLPPSKKSTVAENNKQRARVNFDGHFWVARRRYEYWDRIRLSPREFDTALKKLINLGLVEKKIRKFAGEPTLHVRLIKEKFLGELEHRVNFEPVNPYGPENMGAESPIRENEVAHSAIENSPESPIPYTKNTSKTSTKSIKNLAAHPSATQLLPENGFDGQLDRPALSASVPKDVWDFNEIEEAISDVWRTLSPANVQSLKVTLLGLHPDGSHDAIANVSPPVTPEELHQFGDFYRRRNPGGSFPEAPAKVQKWIYEFRELVEAELEYPVGVVQLHVLVPGYIGTHRGTYDYVNKYYPEEIQRVDKIRELLKGYADKGIEVHEKKSLTWDQSITIPVTVPVPRSIKEAKDIWKFICSEHPEEAQWMNQRRESIQRDQAQRASYLLSSGVSAD
jgi:hypothetical protein